MNFSGLLYGPHYTPGVGFSVFVTLTVDSEAFANVPAMDMTRGQVLDTQPSVEIEDLRPGVRFRAPDLLALGLEPADLDGASCDMNGRTWRIESHVALSTPQGEDAGEIGCILAELGV